MMEVRITDAGRRAGGSGDECSFGVIGLPRHSSAAATLPQASPPPPVRFAFATEPRHIRVTTASRLIFSIRTRWLDDDACGLNDVDEGNRRSVVDEDGWMRRIAITSLPWLPRDRRLAINASRRQATTRIRAIFTAPLTPVIESVDLADWMQ